MLQCIKLKLIVLAGAYVAILMLPVQCVAFSFEYLEAIRFFKIFDLRLIQEKTTPIIKLTLRASHLRKRTLQWSDCDLQIGLRSGNGASLFLGTIREKEFLFPSDVTTNDFPISIVFSGLQKDFYQFFYEIMEDVSSPLSVTLILEGSFILGIEATGGWVKEERFNIKWDSQVAEIIPSFSRQTAATFLFPAPLGIKKPENLQHASALSPTDASSPQQITIETQYGILWEFLQYQSRELAERLQASVSPHALYSGKQIAVESISKKLVSLNDADSMKIESCLAEKIVIYFRFDEARIQEIEGLPNQKEKLSTWAECSSSCNIMGYDLHIEGHADERGSSEYNDKLSLQRAKEVDTYLRETFGIDQWALRRIVSSGFGKRRPIVSEATLEAQHQQNRRVEIYFTNSNGQPMNLAENNACRCRK